MPNLWISKFTKFINSSKEEPFANTGPPLQLYAVGDLLLLVGWDLARFGPALGISPNLLPPVPFFKVAVVLELAEEYFHQLQQKFQHPRDFQASQNSGINSS